MDIKDTPKLRLAGIVRESIVDGPGIRFTVFCQGCPHECPDCHNPGTHDFKAGYDCSPERIIEEIDKDSILAGVTFSGGEPFCQAEAFEYMGRLVKERGLSLTVFSGYTYEELTEMAIDDKAVEGLMELTDILIDGPFIKSLKDLTLQFRGSSNQRIIDMQKTRKEGHIVLWENRI